MPGCLIVSWRLPVAGIDTEPCLRAERSSDAGVCSAAWGGARLLPCPPGVPRQRPGFQLQNGPLQRPAPGGPAPAAAGGWEGL